jgi:outer membrane lipoprotein-sorting protein
MLSWQRLSSCYAAIWLVAATSWAQAVPPAETASALFQSLEAHFSSAADLRYVVEKTSRMERETTKERWAFSYHAPDQVRIDYQEPSERILVANETTLWEYIPAARKAMRTRLDKLPPAKRQAVITSALGRVNVDGIRLGDYHGMLSRVTRIRTDPNQPSVVLVEGENPRFVVGIDTGRNVLVSTELYKPDGALTLRTAASNFKEVFPSFWLPRLIRATYGTEKGFVSTDTALGDFHADAESVKDLFHFIPPKGVTVVEN